VDVAKVLEAKTKRPVFQLGYVPTSVPVKVFLTSVAPVLWSVLLSIHSQCRRIAQTATCSAQRRDWKNLEREDVSDCQSRLEGT
jgi:hypothetical protein